MNFPSIDIQGSIISADLLGQIRSEQARFQQGKDFKPEYNNAKLKDEISFAWQEAKGQWTIYKSKLARLKEGESGTTETRNFWLMPLFANLGYNLAYSRQAQDINGKSYAIGHSDSTLDSFPIYIGGYYESLDKRPENKLLRVSPHAMLQEYLNACEHLYGIVSNGRQIRLLRDASRITRLSYVEFNLEKIMEEDLYADFVILFRLLHASRMPKRIDEGADSIMEKYHQEGLEAGSTIRSKLGDAVKEAIKALANGFLNHPDNRELRKIAAAGNLDLDIYYRHQLRIIYRLLFLFVIEERNLVYADSKNIETKRFHSIYFQYYSLLRLRKLAKKHFPPDAARQYDLWQSLVTTFSLYERKEVGEKMGIMALQGDLFSYSALICPDYDLHQCRLSNVVLLEIIKSLGYFENDNKVLIAVNYGGLDVEEFGSVYEGLLELKLSLQAVEGSEYFRCFFNSSTERGKSGSHYTPEELVHPLIKHSLEYLIEDRVKLYQEKKVNKEKTLQSLLDLKVCDVACGSGHILLSAARRIALEYARIQTEEEQPNPASIRKALKLVIRNCIYGVDKNPLAIELCKVALWLESHNPGEPLNFLDHHIKCGDAIVGLAHRSELENGIADEVFKTLPGDDKNIAKTFRDHNIKERKERLTKGTQLKADFEKNTENAVQEVNIDYKAFHQLPENTPEEIERKAKAYQKFMDGKGFSFLKSMADTQVAQFFIPKTLANKDSLMTDAQFRFILTGYKGWQNMQTSMAKVISIQNCFFHWFLEFPEVFQQGGFDCVLSNPPYLGAKKIRGAYGDYFLNYLHEHYNAGAQTDLISYFVNRDYSIINEKKFVSLITTNTISEGDTKANSIDRIISQRGEIVFVVKSTPWIGSANLSVSLIAFYKGNWHKKKYLGSKEVKSINSFFEDSMEFQRPNTLLRNLNVLFKGNDFAGEGFIITKEDYLSLIVQNSKNNDVLFPLINGKNINDDFELINDRYIINYFDWNLEKAQEYKEVFAIIEEKVKPEREKFKPINSWNIFVKENYWLFGAYRVALNEALRNKKNCFVTSVVTKYLNFTLAETSFVFSNAVYVYSKNSFYDYTILQSSIHNEWIRRYCSSLESRLRYTTTDGFETFPFPQNLSSQQEEQLESIGEAYNEHRKQLMLQIQLGLTKTYNLFHSNAISSQGYEQKDKQILALQKQLSKTPNTISFEAALQGIRKLRALHIEMDNAVLAAYGWQDVGLRHDFYEVDYLPENDRIRYTIHPEARKEVLKRLLALNHQIHAEEVAAGLWDKKKTTYKKSPSVDEVAEDKVGYGGLFEEE